MPTAMPSRMPDGTAPTTQATPGTTATPMPSSRQSNRRRASSGSISARNTGAIAMQVAATDALASLIAP